MVKEIKKDGKKYYQCEECKFLYFEKELAKKCETWCKKYHSCNMDITKHSINLK